MAQFLFILASVCCFVAFTQAIVEPLALPPDEYHGGHGHLPHHPPNIAPAPQHHNHHNHHPHAPHYPPPNQAPAFPPAHHHHHHHHHPAAAPAHPPSHEPVHPPFTPPTHAHPPRHAPVHPPAKPPTHAPAKPPVRPLSRRFVAVQGVVYCKSCKYNGVDNLQGATPVMGAVVKLQCNNTKYPAVVTGETDKNGYFFIEAPKNVTSYAFHRCKGFLVSSPLPKCKKPSNEDGELMGAMLKPEKQFIARGLPFVLYSVGPFAFEPSCPR